MKHVETHGLHLVDYCSAWGIYCLMELIASFLCLGRFLLGDNKNMTSQEDDLKGSQHSIPQGVPENVILFFASLPQPCLVQISTVQFNAV